MALLILTQGFGGPGGGLHAEVLPTFGYGGTEGASCGLPFFFDSVEVIDSRTLRLRWTTPPLATSPSGPTDATNPTLYTLTGPGSPTIDLITAASDDSEVVDAYLNSDLTPGIWSLTISSAIVSAAGRPSMAPYVWNFEIADVQQDRISAGGTNADAEAVVTSFLNPAFRGKPIWQGLMAAYAAGDSAVATYGAAIQDQFFPATASGRYLDRQAANRGLARPDDTGINDALFQQLIISVTNRKLTQDSFLRIGEILYGPDAVRAFAAASTAEPYVLDDGSTLSLLLDETNRVDVTFQRAAFQILRRARAAEVAAVVNRALEGTQAYAEAVTDPVTGATHLRIYSGRRGLRSAVRIVGGTAQPALGLPTEMPHSSGAMPTWTITKSGNRYRWSTPSDATYNLSQIVAGDYVVVRGFEFNSANRGSLPILDVHYEFSGSVLSQWFETDVGTAETVTQCTAASLVFYRPTKRTVYDYPAAFLVAQQGGVGFVSMAATTQAVERDLTNAAYLHSATPVAITTAVRDAIGGVVVTTAIPHGLAAGSQVIIDGAVPAAPGTSTGGLAAPPGFLGAGQTPTGPVAAAETDSFVERILAGAVTDRQGDLVIVGGQTASGGSFTSKLLIDTAHDAGAAGEGGRSYSWTEDDVSGASNKIRALGRALAVMTDAAHDNHILVAGGYTVGPWAAQSATAFDAAAYQLTKAILREDVLVAAQLDNAQGIKGALQVVLTANPTAGQLLTITTGGANRTYGFGSSGDVVVTIGGSAAATMINLAAAITADGAAAWKAVATSLPPSGTTVVVYENIVGTGACPLRAYGTAPAAVVSYAGRPDYGVGTKTALALADPGLQGGFRRPVAALTDGETHRVLTGTHESWSNATSTWTTQSPLRLWTQSTSGTMPVALADAAGCVIGDGSVLVSGGSTFGSSTTGLNVASNALHAYNPTTATWSAVSGGLRVPRLQHQMVPLQNGYALVIGGRQPATPTAGEFSAFTFWPFEEAAATTTFAGPVTVNRNANVRPAGKCGWGVTLSSRMESTGGGAQTTLNTEMLSDWTIAGWATSGQGAFWRNGVDTWGAAADNTLVEVGVDPADDLFYVAWQHGSGILETRKTTMTRSALMPISDSLYPRYYHVALTKTVSGANAIFTLYIEGEVAGTWVGTKPDNGGSGTWRFGDTGTVAAYAGSIDQVGFAVGGLSAVEVRRLYQLQVGVSYDAPTYEGPVGTVLSSCEAVDDTTSRYLTAPMGYARFAHATVVLPDHRILVAGGVGYINGHAPTNQTQAECELRSAEIYDPNTGIWTPLPDMREPHSYGAAALIGTKVYITGGFASKLVEYLDLVTMRWGVAATTLGSVRGQAQGGVSGALLVLAGGASINVGDVTTAPQDVILAGGNEVTRAGGLNGTHQVLTTPTSTTFTMQDSVHRIYTAYTGGTATAAAAPNDGRLGPYVYDPTAGYGVSAVVGATTASIMPGTQVSSLSLGSGEAEPFPDEPGYVILDWGDHDIVVRYLGRIDPDTLALDASYVFPVELPSGTRVHLISRGAFVGIRPFWVTAAPAGRVAAQDLINRISAGGIELDVTIRYPGDRGVGGEGYSTHGADKLSGIVEAFAGNDVDAELATARTS